MYLYPTWCFFDTLTSVIRPPSFDKAQPENAQSSQIVNTDTSSGTGVHHCTGKGIIAYTKEKRIMIQSKEAVQFCRIITTIELQSITESSQQPHTSHSCSLYCYCCTSLSGLPLHFLIAMVQIKYLRTIQT